jgi:glycine cleavage system pyridoxal-binding protein P
MSYLSLTDADREEMLRAIGVDSVEELFRDVPAGVRFDRELDVPPALTEVELQRHLEELAARNVVDEVCFLGAGVYDHHVPAVVDAVLQRGELLTAYTPYQPEMSQGVLQAIFEYQTAICELTGMDVSNASGYDGTTVAADACFVAKHATGRSKIVVTEATNPQVRQVVKTYAPGFGLEVVEVPLQLRLRERGRHVELAVVPDTGRDLAEELVDRRDADGREHRVAVGVREREIAHASSRTFLYPARSRSCDCSSALVIRMRISHPSPYGSSLTVSGASTTFSFTSSTSPESGEMRSETAFTDSTSPYDASFEIVAPTAGGS